jgi:hypothetical protein
MGPSIADGGYGLPDGEFRPRLLFGGAFVFPCPRAFTETGNRLLIRRILMTEKLTNRFTFIFHPYLYDKRRSGAIIYDESNMTRRSDSRFSGLMAPNRNPVMKVKDTPG